MIISWFDSLEFGVTVEFSSIGREEHKRARLLLESKGSQLFRSISSIVLLALRGFLFNASCSDVPLLELFLDKGLLLAFESVMKTEKFVHVPDSIKLSFYDGTSIILL